MVVETQMPGETRFEQLLGDPHYFERAFARARARAEQRQPVPVPPIGPSPPRPGFSGQP